MYIQRTRSLDRQVDKQTEIKICVYRGHVDRQIDKQTDRQICR